MWGIITRRRRKSYHGKCVNLYTNIFPLQTTLPYFYNDVCRITDDVSEMEAYGVILVHVWEKAGNGRVRKVLYGMSSSSKKKKQEGGK